MMRKQFFAGAKSATLGGAALLLAFSAALLFAYNTFQDNLGTLQAPLPAASRWANLPVTWLFNSYTPANNVSTTGCSIAPSSCIQQSLANGFTTWISAMVQGQSLTDLAVQYDPTLSSLTAPDVADCKNVVGFSDSASDFSTGTVAFTELATVTASQYRCSDGSIKTCPSGSCIADADIEFNPNYTFYTNTVPSGIAFNLQSVATHEEGHLLGMDHSGIGHAMMFPFGDTEFSGQPLSLAADDSIGISSLYPCVNPGSGPSCTAKFSTATGKISGTVTLNSAGAFGAHVVAIDTATGDVVMDGLTAPDGSYTLVGVPPGNYHVLVLPLAPDANSGILLLDDFSGWDCGYGDSNCSNVPQNPTNYTGRFF
ncbi:MAG TPA: matrixin family metalloprotease [Terriglobia bacterium]|nr:matrixin family metalloprotease [Terriglobia bacterium]